MKGNLKICFFPGALNLGGVGRLTINLAEEMIKEGLEVDFFLTMKKGNYLDHIPEKVNLFYGSGSALKSILSFSRYLLKNKPQAIISSRDYLNVLCILITKTINWKTKVIASVHVDYSGMPKRKITIKDRILHFCYKKIYKKADSIVAVSRGVAEDFSRRFSFPLEKIHVIYNPTFVPSKYLNPRPIKYSEFFDTSLPIIISVGRLNEQKNFALLINAFLEVKKSTSAKLLILGEGEERETLQDLIDKNNLANSAVLGGYVDNPIDYIKKSNVFVMSSSWEGFGNVLVEALGTGISVVSTDCPSGPAEILEDGRFGYLVPLHDPQEMAKAILLALKKPFKKSMNINRAKEFSVQKISNLYLELIK